VSMIPPTSLTRFVIFFIASVFRIDVDANVEHEFPLCGLLSRREKEKKTNRIDYKIVRNTTILFHLFKQAIWVTGIYPCICGIVH